MIVRLKAARTAARDEARLALMRAVAVRHRVPGHVRFDLPPALTTPAAVDALERGLGGVEGVYRVTVFTGAAKLSVRWAEEVCSLAEVARRLAAVVAAVADGTAAPPAARPGLAKRVKALAPVARWRAKAADWKAKADMLGRLVALKGGAKPGLPFDAKDWAMHFVNDLVVYYLIRVHWERIVRQWLPNPWAYRYQWLTVVYLTFLLVKFRKAKK